MNSITLGNTVIKYDIVRSKRKSLGIIIDPDDGVIIRSPEKTSEEKINKIVQSKSSWILEKLDKVNQIKPGPAPKEFMSGEKLPYLGRRYRLQVNKQKNFKKVQVAFYRGKFIIEVPSKITDEEDRRNFIREELIQWYREHADIKIKERVDKYKGKIGVKPNLVRVKKQKKRWGSCSSKGNLNFNWKIIMAPMSVVDYIVIHELIHLLYPNHSDEFWKLMEAIIPDYKKRQEWLRINGRRLDF